MGAVVTLFTVNALMGFALAGTFSWLGIGLAGIAFALLSAAVLHLQGFGALSGIAITAACLTVNQISYLAGRLCASPQLRDQIHKQDDNETGHGRNR
jgi:hypothetical protein